jgi:hypothetical protein
MAKDEFQVVQDMLKESQKIAKNGTPQELINAVSAIEQYARENNLTRFANEAKKKLAILRNNLR